MLISKENEKRRKFALSLEGPVGVWYSRVWNIHSPTLVKFLTFFPGATVADSGFFKNFLYQGGVKSTVSWVFEDLNSQYF